jgi:glutathione S-transferase
VNEPHATPPTTLYRCNTPTNVLCPCGKVARRLHDAGIEFEEIRVPMRKTRRAEVIALTGQNVVPVLLHDGEAIHDSKRIVEYLDSVDGKAA